MFTDAIIEIIEKTDGNEIVRGVLLENLYANPSDGINNEVRGRLGKFLGKNKKHQYKCGHNSCEEMSCYSHEISKNIFLKHLADKKSNVYVLKPDFENNALNYTFALTHKRNASNFPGYCRSHDASLFTDIESQFSGVNKHFINKQCLRIIRRELFRLEFRLKVLKELIGELEVIVNNEDVQLMLNQLNNKLSINEKLKRRADSIYGYVNKGLINKNYYINYKDFNVNKRGYCFSAMLDFTTDEDESSVVFFIIKLEDGISSKYIVCYINNDLGLKLSSKLYPEDLCKKMFLSEIMHSHKERFVFSESFKNNLDEYEYKSLVSNPDFFNISNIEKLILSKVFF